MASHLFFVSSCGTHSDYLFLPQMCCNSCGNHFSTCGLESHLLQSNNSACWDEFCKQNQAHSVDVADEDIHMEIADDEQYVQTFGGDFFRTNYHPEDFEGFNCNDDTNPPDSDSDSIYHKHDLEPEIYLPIPSPKPEEEGGRGRKWGLALSIDDQLLCKILTAIHMLSSLTIPMAVSDTLPSHEQYKSNIGAASIYTPFKSELDWKTTQWAKMWGPGLTVFSELLSIPWVYDHLVLTSKKLIDLSRSTSGLGSPTNLQRSSTK